MRLNQLTTKFELARADVQRFAVDHRHQSIDPIHLLIALLDQ
jgi:hypothetical protein